MPFDPSGNFTRVHNWQQDRDNGIRILADRHDEEDDNFAEAFNQVFLRTGTTPMIGDLVMNGNKITMLGAGSETVPSLTWELSNNTGWWQPSPNALAVSTQGTKRLEVNNDGLSVYGGVNAKSFYITDAPNPIFSVSGGNPLLGFSSGNFILFEVSTGVMKFVIEGVVKHQINNYAVQSLAPHFFGNIEHRIESQESGPYYIVDSGDYWRFTRATNLFEWVVGEQVKMSISPTSVNFNVPVQNVGGVFIAPNGNAANPGYRFQDNDSGLFSGGDGSVAISTNAVSRMQIDGAGGVSIINSPELNISGITYFNKPTVTDFYATVAGGGEFRHVNFAPNAYVGFNTTSRTLQVSAGGGGLTINKDDMWATFSHNLSVNGALGVAGNISGNGIYGAYVESSGMVSAKNGLLSSRGSGLGAGVQIINTTVGHDYRILAKDPPISSLQITNESIGIAYVEYHHTGNVTTLRETSHQGVNHVNNTWNFNSRDMHWVGLTVDNSALIIQGANGALNFKARDTGYDWLNYATGGALRFWQASGGDAWHMQEDRYFRPALDSAFAVGHPSFRMNAVFCVSSTMQTCDEREKDWLGELTEAELAFGRDLMKEIGTFRWLEGHDDNTVQIGVRAQKTIALMAKHGLDWNDYGFIRHDEWEESTSNGPIVGEDEDGNPVYEQIVTPAGDRYSVRLPELSLFMMAAQEQRLQALEEKL